MESKKCTVCNVEKPLYAFYKKKEGTHESSCIKCISSERSMSNKIKKEGIEVFVVDKVALYRYYLVTFVDKDFNEYSATLSVRLNYTLTPAHFNIKGFNIAGERMFYEANVSEMAMEEYYTIHDKHKDLKSIRCPTITIKSGKGQSVVWEWLHEFMTGIYFYHNES